MSPVVTVTAHHSIVLAIGMNAAQQLQPINCPCFALSAQSTLKSTLRLSAAVTTTSAQQSLVRA